MEAQRQDQKSSQQQATSKSSCTVSSISSPDSTNVKSSLATTELDETWDNSKPFVCFSVMTLVTVAVLLLGGYILSMSVLSQVVSIQALPNLFQMNGVTLTHLISRTPGELSVSTPKLLGSNIDNKAPKTNSWTSMLRSKQLNVYITDYPENISSMNVYTLDEPPSAVTYVPWKWETGANLTEFMNGSSGQVLLQDITKSSVMVLSVRNGTSLSVKYQIGYDEGCDACQVKLAIINPKEWTTEKKSKLKMNATPGLLSVYSLNTTVGAPELNIDIDARFSPNLGFVLFYENYDEQRSQLSNLALTFNYSIPSFSIPVKYSKRYLNVKPETKIEDKKYLLVEYTTNSANYGGGVPFLGKLKFMELAPESLLGIALSVSMIVLCLTVDLVLVLSYCYKQHINTVHHLDEERGPLLPAVTKAPASVSTLGSTN